MQVLITAHVILSEEFSTKMAGRKDFEEVIGIFDHTKVDDVCSTYLKKWDYYKHNRSADYFAVFLFKESGYIGEVVVFDATSPPSSQERFSDFLKLVDKGCSESLASSIK